MAAVRILASVTLNVELFDVLDGPDGRLGNEAASLGITAGNAFSAGVGESAFNGNTAAKPLNADPCDYEKETRSTRARPFFVLRNMVPTTFSVLYNTFRKADEMEITIPLAYLPVPPEAIRAIVAYAVIRHVTADEWAAGIDGLGAAPQLAPDLSNADFAGICIDVRGELQPDSIPTIKLPFRDFTGLLAQHKVEPGKGINRELALSESLRDFLKGTPAEGMCVTWIDKAQEPTVSQHLPKTQKKPRGKGKEGMKTTAPLKSIGSYLDAVTEECARLGCVARVNVMRLELCYAGPLYEGRLPTNNAKVIVCQTIESVSWEHKLVGLKTQSVQLVGHNPGTGETLTARWPPDPKTAGATVIEPGKPPRLPPLMANVGLPGYEQLDESIILIPVGPIGSKDVLSRMAQDVFLQRTAQRIRYELKTHCPWSDPSNPDKDGGDLLRLRAGDRVTFGYIASGQNPDNVLLPPAVLAVTGELGEGALRQVLQTAGVSTTTAAKVAQLLTRVPRFSTFRVDEVHVSGGATQDAEITIRLANFTQITTDLQDKAESGPSPIGVVAALEARIPELILLSLEKAQAELAQAYEQIYLGSPQDSDARPALARLDEVAKKVLGNR